MAINPRNLLLFAALAGTALLTWILARVADEDGVTATDSGPSPGDYYMQGAVIHVTDDLGQPVYRIHAERVEPEAESDDIVLDEMRVEYMPQTGVRWDVFAVRGVADASSDTLRLSEGVRLVYATEPGQDEAVFETNELHLYAEGFYATTDVPVTMRRGSSEIVATSLELDLNTDEYELGSRRDIDGPNVTYRGQR